MKKYRTDVMVIAALLLAGLIIFIAVTAAGGRGKLVRVSVDGKIVEELDLDTDTVREIEGFNGGRNLLIIKNGKARISEASCPDRLCVGMGETDSPGKAIVCLPNRVVVEIAGEADKTQVDAVTG